MLIFPIQNRPDWSRPPLMTLALICVNVLVFLLYQSADRDKLQLAADIYQEYQLGQIEAPYYREYQSRERPSTPQPAPDKTIDADRVLGQVIYDRAFDAYLREQWRSGEVEEPLLSRWRQQRREFESIRNRVSAIALGLTPAEAKPVTFITSQFLHGGWGHLLGNMVFLFLFGFTLELALRPWAYLGMYLISGIAADLLFIAINPGSWVPLVGASGAISGLMGMYLALYRLKPIRFFYTVGFYFGEFTAPALWIFPLWIAKELYGHFFVDSNTAYWAHIGGLLAGAAMMLLFTRVRQDFTEKERGAEQQSELEQKLGSIQAAVARMDFDRARRGARVLCQQYPDSPEPWLLNFQLYKNQPGQRAFHQQALAFIQRFVAQRTPSPQWVAHGDQLIKEYRELAPKAPALNAQAALALAKTYWRCGERKTATRWLDYAKRKGASAEAVDSLSRLMGRAHGA